MTRSLARNNPSELWLMDLENMRRMTDHLSLTEMEYTSYPEREMLDNG